ncbi:MAG: glycogen synthase [Nitrospirae bacterium]|nr:glycogen synthase [Nitrospirota bacterium]
MKIAVVTSEAVPFSKTGGLADVAGTLFKEYMGMGLDTFLFVPLYKKTAEQFAGVIQDAGMEMDIQIGRVLRKCKVFTLSKNFSKKVYSGNPAVFLIGNDEFFGRDELYGMPSGDYPDNDQRFVFFCRSVLEICSRLSLNIDIMHCNDWQTGLIPLYLKTLYRESPEFKKTMSVITIHNLGYQGLFPSQTMETAGLSMSLFNPEGVEFYGKVNFLKAGLIGADIITTVSKTYAQEILTPEFGFGLDGILRKRADSIVGILNGIDYTEWDPSTDAFLPRNYNKSDLSGKLSCKKELMGKISLKSGLLKPLMCFIGRFSAQKGIDILADAIPELTAQGANIVIIGTGDERYQIMLSSLQKRFNKSLFLYAGFDEPFANLAYAGSDMFLMPSRYEPCGLGQMIAMRYGTIPVARRTGGISDTVEDKKTGFVFAEYSAASFLNSIKEALSAYADKKAWQKLIKSAMSRDFSWGKSAKMYIEVYKKVLKANNQRNLQPYR